MKSKNIAIAAMLGAMIVLFMSLSISFGPVRLAVLVLLPVIIAAQLVNFKVALFVSLMFGLSSLVMAWAQPVSPVSYCFRNPLISVLPRIFIGPSVYGISALISKFIKTDNFKKRKVANYFKYLFSSIIGVLTNTALVLTMIAVRYYNRQVGDTTINAVFIQGLVTLNFVIEIVVIAIIEPAIAIAVEMRRKV